MAWQDTWALHRAQLQTTEGAPLVMTCFALGTLTRGGVCELFSKATKEATDVFQDCQRRALSFSTQTILFSLMSLKIKGVCVWGGEMPYFKHVLKVRFFAVVVVERKIAMAP